MELSQSALCLIFIYSMFIGVTLGVVYDVFRIQRLSMSGMNAAVQIIIFVEDIIFSVISAVVMTVMIFHVNNGQVRWFAFAGAGVGFIIYYCTVGRLMMLCSGYIISFIRACINFVKRPIQKRIRKLRMKLFTKRYKSAMLKAASAGFDWQGSETKWSRLSLRKKLKSKRA